MWPSSLAVFQVVVFVFANYCLPRCHMEFSSSLLVGLWRVYTKLDILGKSNIICYFFVVSFSFQGFEWWTLRYCRSNLGGGFEIRNSGWHEPLCLFTNVSYCLHELSDMFLLSFHNPSEHVLLFQCLSVSSDAC